MRRRQRSTAGPSVRARHEFPIGDGRVLEADRDSLWTSCRLQINQLMNGEFGDGSNRPSEGCVQRILLRLRQDRQPQGFPVHIAGDGFEQRPVMADPALDSCRIEQVSAVVAINDKLGVFRYDIEKQIEIHKALGIGVGRDGKILEVKILLDPLQIELRFDQGKPVDLAWQVKRPDERPESVTLMICRIEKQLLGFARRLE